MERLKRILAFVLSIAMVLSLVSMDYKDVHADDVSTYISSCTTYASLLTVRTKATTSLMTYPCSSATNSSSKVSAKVTKATSLNVYALYKNTAGEYWYKIVRFGKTLYVKAMDVEMITHQVGDVTITDPVSPASLGYGHGFPIGGTIKSTYNTLGTVTASLYTGINTTVAPYLTSSDTVNGRSYSLKGSNVDNNLLFNKLAKGDYTYIVTAEAVSNYIDGNGKLQQAKKTVVLEEQKCIVTNASSPNAVAAKGIDVSTWQGNIDWAKASKEIDFAILRASYSTSTDDKFKRNADACTQYGVPFGVYVYSYATTVAQVQAEANHVLSLVKKYDLALPIFFDFEDESQAALSTSAKISLVKAFVKIIKDAGYEPGLYTFLSWFNNNFSDSYFNSLPKWVAQIEVNNCSYTRGVRMWQYSWKGKVSGISGDVDCNYYYGTFPGTNPDTSYLKKCTHYPSNLDVKTTEDVTVKKYPCWYGTDNSSTDVKEVTSGTAFHVTGLYKNSIGEYWYQVENDSTYGYIPADRAKVIGYRYDDIAVRNPLMADNLNVGAGYPISGTMYSRYNKMSTIKANVYNNENINGTTAIKSSHAADTNSYKLKASEVDKNLIFSDLKEGYYTYELSADVKNYYVKDSGELTNQSKNVVVWSKTFTVGSTTISHTHTKVADAAVAASCSTTGLTAGEHCSTCNEITKEQKIVEKTSHTPGDTVKENEVAGVSYDSVVYCTVCKGEVSRKTIMISTDSTAQEDGTTEKKTTKKEEESSEEVTSSEKDTTKKEETSEEVSSGEKETTEKQESSEKPTSSENETTEKEEVTSKDISSEDNTTSDGETTKKEEVSSGVNESMGSTDKNEETTDKNEETTGKNEEATDENEETTDNNEESTESHKIKLEDAFLLSEIKNYTYTGREITQKIVLKDGEKNLVGGIDYNVYYRNNIDVGTATLVIVGDGIYQDSIVKQYKISRKAISNPKVSLEKAKYTYTGKALKPTVTVKNGNTKLSLNKDYKVTYSNNIKPGKATIKISFINNYIGSVTKNFTITPAQVKGQKQSGFGTKNVTITWNKVASVSGYEVYRSSKKTGTYTKVKTITGSTNKFTHNNLKSGTVYYYKIRAYKKSGSSYIYGAFSNVMSATTKPGAVTIKASAGTKRAVISWNKVNGAKGYEVYMATSKNGKYTKIATKNALMTKVEKSKLTSKKNYYFKVRAYTTTATGKKVYSEYSAIKSVKVK